MQTGRSALSKGRLILLIAFLSLYFLFQWNRKILKELKGTASSSAATMEQRDGNIPSSSQDIVSTFLSNNFDNILTKKKKPLVQLRGMFDEDGELVKETGSNSTSSFVKKIRFTEFEDYLNQIEKMKCPSTAEKIIFLYPHVNKAGGRSIEGTFDDPDIRHRFVSSSPRSRRSAVKFELRNGHKTFRELSQLHCSSDPYNRRRSKVLKAKDCEDKFSNQTACTRWIFTMREPMSRTLSAFYASAGREVISEPDLRTHFSCPDGSQGANVLSNPKSTFEDFANLAKEKQEECYPRIANRYVHYLAGEVVGNDTVKLEIAKRRLERMGWIGLAEEFDKSIRLLSWTFGLDLVLYTPVFNVNDYSKALSYKAEECLKSMNSLDIQLYNFAKKLYNKRLYLMERFLKENEDHTSEYFPFTCDKDIICWDKTKGVPIPGSPIAQVKPVLETIGDDYWSIKSPPKRPDNIPQGEWKERVVCAPKRGCFRG